ncbi:MAG: hypothetical protein QGI52_02900 [Alphaproteobacteria bacterium]|nr:hypothetical protein [Alphaproteobacteria bacterium]MDP7641376.1 hypothetical protein [Alphaproteobacteria bacterium]
MNLGIFALLGAECPVAPPCQFLQQGRHIDADAAAAVAVTEYEDSFWHFYVARCRWFQPKSAAPKINRGGAMAAQRRFVTGRSLSRLCREICGEEFELAEVYRNDPERAAAPLQRRQASALRRLNEAYRARQRPV